MESQCHSGTTCSFDLKWSNTILHHRIAEVIDSILSNWVNSYEEYPIKCVDQQLHKGENGVCSDCNDWRFCTI